MYWKKTPKGKNSNIKTIDNLQVVIEKNKSMNQSKRSLYSQTFSNSTEDQLVGYLIVNKPLSVCKKVWKILYQTKTWIALRKVIEKWTKKGFWIKSKISPLPLIKLSISSTKFRNISENCQTSLSHWKSHSKQLWFPWLTL